MKRYLHKIIFILFIISFMFVSKPVYGADATTGHTSYEVGQQIANWAIDFYNNHKSQCRYNVKERANYYNAEINNHSVYKFDCVGWVSFAIHHATGLGGNSFTIFAGPTGTKDRVWNVNNFATNGFEEIWRDETGLKSSLPTSVTVLPGDILIAEGHVGIYVGKDENGTDRVVDMWRDVSGGLGYRTMSEFTSGSNGRLMQIGRVSEETAARANFEFIADGVILPGSTGSGSGGGTSSASNFEFNGMPTQVSISSRKDATWLFNKISQFFAFFAGLIINILKFAILGYIIIFENIANSFLNSSSESLNAIDATTNTLDATAYIQYTDTYSLGLYTVEEKEFGIVPIEAAADSDGGSGGVSDIQDGEYTIEDIIYNNIPLLDVNIFTSTPGGQQIPDDSIVAIIRGIISGWYVSFRNLALIALVIMVMYLGIRIALSTIPEKSGQYKTALWSWVVSIILVFIIHYFMVVVFNINERILSLFETANSSEISIYDTIRTRALDTRLYIGIPATIMYLVLIIYFYKFLWVYMKRYFTIMILIIIAPFICAKYAFDGAKGKRGTSISSWMYDFGMNVIIQSVHALLYTTLMGVAINMAVSSVWGFILALVFINFILKADKIFFDIFNFGRGANVADVSKQFSKEDVAGGLFAIHFTKKAFAFGASSTKKVARSARIVGRNAYGIALDKLYEEDASEVRRQIREIKNNMLDRKDEHIDSKYRKLYKLVGIDKGSENAQLRMLARKGGTVGRRARTILRARKDLKRKKYKAAWQTTKNVPLSVLSIAGGIPMFVASPKIGYAMISRGIKNYRKLTKPKSDVPGYRVRYHGVERIAQIGTLGMYGLIKNTQEDHKKQKKKEGEISRTIDYIKQVDTHYDTAREKWKQVSENLTEEEKSDLVGKIKLVTVDGSTDMLKSSVYNYLNSNEMAEVTRENISDVIDSALSTTGLAQDLTEEQISKVKQKVINEHNYSENRFTKQIDSVADEVHKAVLDINYNDGPIKDLVKEIDAIEGINEKAQKDVKQPIVDTGRLIRDMRVSFEGEIKGGQI